jgi:integrase
MRSSRQYGRHFVMGFWRHPPSGLLGTKLQNGSAMRRSRRGGVEDLWTKTVRDADGNTSPCPAPKMAAGCAGVQGISTSVAASTPRRSAARSTRSSGSTSRQRRSYLHSRLSQIISDAVHDGVLAADLPADGKAKVYVATTEQVWAIHDAVPDHLRVAVRLSAFAGLRVAEVAGLRKRDVDSIRGVVHPKEQWPGKPLKTAGSAAPVPIPRDLALLLSASLQKYPSDFMVTNGPGTERCGPWVIDRAIRDVRDQIDDLPEGFSFHDLRHYLASLLIASGADIKTVQARLRHATARTTLDTYGHLWPDADESTRTAVGNVIAWLTRRSTARTRTGSPGG